MANHTKLDFINIINKKRLDHKNDWYLFVGDVDNKRVIVKGYNTWLQRFTIDGVDHSNCMGESVKDFKETLSIV